MGYDEEHRAGTKISTEIEENELDPTLSMDHFFEVEEDIKN